VNLPTSTKLWHLCSPLLIAVQPQSSLPNVFDNIGAIGDACSGITGFEMGRNIAGQTLDPSSERKEKGKKKGKRAGNREKRRKGNHGMKNGRKSATEKRSRVCNSNKQLCKI